MWQRQAVRFEHLLARSRRTATAAVKATSGSQGPHIQVEPDLHPRLGIQLERVPQLEGGAAVLQGRKGASKSSSAGQAAAAAAAAGPLPKCRSRGHRSRRSARRTEVLIQPSSEGFCLRPAGEAARMGGGGAAAAIVTSRACRQRGNIGFPAGLPADIIRRCGRRHSAQRWRGQATSSLSVTRCLAFTEGSVPTHLLLLRSSRPSASCCYQAEPLRPAPPPPPPPPPPLRRAPSMPPAASDLALELVPHNGQVLRELVPVLGLQVALHVLQAGGGRSRGQRRVRRAVNAQRCRPPAASGSVCTCTQRCTAPNQSLARRLGGPLP